MYYRWIDMEMPAWAVTEIRERSRRAWASFDAEERREKAAAEEKAEQERELKEYYAEQKGYIQDLLKKNREEARRMEKTQRQRNEAREAERQRKKERKKERAREAEAAEEAGDGKEKYPAKGPAIFVLTLVQCICNRKELIICICCNHHQT
jgi:hypothetical protein